MRGGRLPPLFPGLVAAAGVRLRIGVVLAAVASPPRTAAADPDAPCAPPMGGLSVAAAAACMGEFEGAPLFSLSSGLLAARTFFFFPLAAGFGVVSPCDPPCGRRLPLWALRLGYKVGEMGGERERCERSRERPPARSACFAPCRRATLRAAPTAEGLSQETGVLLKPGECSWVRRWARREKRGWEREERGGEEVERGCGSERGERVEERGAVEDGGQ